MKKMLWLLSAVLILSACVQQKATQTEYIKNSGMIYGTFYNLTYQHPEGKDLQEEVMKVFKQFDLSLSTFNDSSVISRINRNDESIQTDAHFERMYQQAEIVSTLTGGAFDITVAPLVNAWGFGFGKQNRSATPNVDSILAFTGFHKLQLIDHRIVKTDPRIMLDASAIAKGQASDVVAAFLEEQGCVNYMVEIGGEVTCKGMNPKGDDWQIGIDMPIDDPAVEDRSLQTIVAISDVGLATSGNYRQYYYRNNKKYAHTINPRTGYPVDHNLLSATVIAPTCMQAEAFATAFMVLGVDSSLVVCNQVADMECYLIYSDENGAFQVAQSAGFGKYIAE